MQYKVEYIFDGIRRSITVKADDELTALFLAGYRANVLLNETSRIKVVMFSSQ